MAVNRGRSRASSALGLGLGLAFGAAGCGGKSRAHGPAAMASGGEGFASSGVGGAASTAGISSGGNVGALAGNSAMAGRRASCDDLESVPSAPIAGGALSRRGQSVCVLVGGSVACWGRADNGQLGDGQAHLDPGVSDPVWVASLDDALEVGLGQGFACARRNAGNIACWGLGDRGQLGDGSFHEKDKFAPRGGEPTLEVAGRA